jgi:hypothetical protein
MAEFSKEYANIIGDKFYDSSYSEMFEELEEDEYVGRICEGLGTLGIHNIKGVYHFIITYEGEVAEYSTFLQAFQLLHNEKVKQRKKHKRE